MDLLALRKTDFSLTDTPPRAAEVTDEERARPITMWTRTGICVPQPNLNICPPPTTTHPERGFWAHIATTVAATASAAAEEVSVHLEIVKHKPSDALKHRSNRRLVHLSIEGVYCSKYHAFHPKIAAFFGYITEKNPFFVMTSCNYVALLTLSKTAARTNDMTTLMKLAEVIFFVDPIKTPPHSESVFTYVVRILRARQSYIRATQTGSGPLRDHYCRGFQFLLLAYAHGEENRLPQSIRNIFEKVVLTKKSNKRKVLE